MSLAIWYNQAKAPQRPGLWKYFQGELVAWIDLKIPIWRLNYLALFERHLLKWNYRKPANAYQILFPSLTEVKTSYLNVMSRIWCYKHLVLSYRNTGLPLEPKLQEFKVPAVFDRTSLILVKLKAAMASLSVWFISWYQIAFLFYAGSIGGYHSWSTTSPLWVEWEKGQLISKRCGEIRTLTSYETQQKFCTD